MSKDGSSVRLSEEQRLDWLCLIRSDNVGPRTFRALVNHYGGARAALAALPDLARRGGASRAARVHSRQDAEGFRRLELTLGVLAGVDAGGTARAAAAGEIGQRRQRRACAAIVVDQRAEGARADVVAADEAKPIEPLLLAQPHAIAVLAHGMIRFGWRTRLGVLYVRTTGNMAGCAIERAAISA